ncbi:uncharacterized protein LOC129920893 [Episyrphus balteatus]|uniref:uncharacterized protein LOC129920893 n=1 Tax=Episyrphus balteatus TaxID=286459 RepID=UPI0024855BE7|nr:uncharacterized protein LOC129920893 [Episyrphus balteatus]
MISQKLSICNKMGSCIGKKFAHHKDLYEAPSLEEILPEVSTDSYLSSNANINYDLNLYLYRQQMQQKDRELITWCSAKLELTENIIRINQSRLHKNMFSIDLSTLDEITMEIEHLEEYRKKLIDLIKHLKKINLRLTSKNVRKKRSHKCAMKIITALTEVISAV